VARALSLEHEIAQRTGVRTSVENDANALAIYEQAFGSGRETDSFAVMLRSKGPKASGAESSRTDNSCVGAMGRPGRSAMIQRVWTTCLLAVEPGAEPLPVSDAESTATC
jgi:hypothetical protein